MWSYFFAAGLSTAGAGSIAFNSLLTLITGGSALSQARHQARDDLFNRFKFPRWSWQPLSSGTAFILMSLLIGVRTTLPLMATHFKQSGEQKYLAGDLNTALENYQRAIALRPDYAEAHYNLGTLYEDFQKTDQAIAEYQLVVQSDLDSQPNSPKRLLVLRAHNNLGRLYLLKGNTQAAWVFLEKGLRFVDADAAAKNADIQYEHYKLLKNLGWVQLQQKSYLDATNYLQEAIDLQPQLKSLFAEAGGQAAPFCLQAQVLQILEAQKQNKATQTAWETCLQYAQGSNSDEAKWIGMAHEYLSNQGTEP